MPHERVESAHRPAQAPSHGGGTAGRGGPSSAALLSSGSNGRRSGVSCHLLPSSARAGGEEAASCAHLRHLRGLGGIERVCVPRKPCYRSEKPIDWLAHLSGESGRQEHLIEAPAHSRDNARTRLGLENREVSRERCPSLVAPLDEREREGELAQHPPKLFTASRERVASIHVARRCLQCSGRLRVKRQDLAVHSTDERPQEYIVDTDREIHDRLLDRDDAKLRFAGKSRRLAAGLCEGLRAPHTPRQTCAVWRCRAPPETAVAVPSA